MDWNESILCYNSKMKKIAIKFSIDKFDDIKSIAEHLQHFIIEDDYTISSISKKIIANELIVLGISMEENIPSFIEFTEELNDEKVVYELYKIVNGDWDKYELDNLELDTMPKRISTFIGLNILWSGIMTFLQFFYIYDWYSEKYEWGGIASIIVSFFTASVPIYSSVVAYWSVTELSNWESYEAVLVFFGYYFPFLWIMIKVFYEKRWYLFWHS